MKTILHTLAITRKEIQLILRGGGALALFFLLPLLLGVVMGGANLAANPKNEEAAILLQVALVNGDEGGFGREIASAVESIPQLAVQRFSAANAAEEQVAKGEAAAAIVIPAGFSAQIEAHNPTAIDVIVDPAQPQSASIVSGIMNQVVSEAAIWGEVQYGVRTFMADAGVLTNATTEQRRAVEAQNLGVIMTVLNEMRRTPVIAVVTEDIAGAVIGPTIEQFIALLFAGFAVMFIFINVSWSSASLLEERAAGTLRRLLSAPISRVAIIAGKMLAFMLLSCAQAVVLFGVAAAFFRIPLGRSPAALILLTVVVGLASASLGMLVAAIARSENQASNIGVILGLVLAGLGGAFTMGNLPAIRLGGFIGTLASLTPQGHAINGFYSVMAENAGLVQILPQLGFLLAASVIFAAIAAWRFRFES